MNSAPIKVATIGRCVGLDGELKLHILSDFPSQFQRGAKFYAFRDKDLDTLEHKDSTLLEIFSFNSSRSLVKFVGYQDRSSALKLVNCAIFTTIDETKRACNLKENEFFWFDIIDLSVYEGDILLGRVKDIERIGEVDYLQIETSRNLQESSMSKVFMIPYVDKYIIDCDLQNRAIRVKGGYDILEAS